MEGLTKTHKKGTGHAGALAIPQCPFMVAPALPSAEPSALAPAAGAGVGKLVAEKLLSDPEFIPLMIKAAKGGLEASRSFYDKGAGGCVTEPDYRVRVQTLALLLAHMEGEPIKRVIHEIRKGVGGAPDEMLAESPAAIEAAKRMIAGAEARRRKAGLKKAEVVDVEA